MHTRPSILSLVAITVLTAMLAPATAFAQAAPAYPNKPVKMIVGFTAGGTIDLTARIIGQALQQKLGQPFVIDNKIGANGMLAAEFVAQSPPDGYTVFVSNSSTITLNPTLFKNTIRYQPTRDFAPVTTVVSVPLVLAVNANDPETANIKNVADLISRAKVTPGALNYGSAGNGNITHLAFELFSDMAGMKMTHVPYKGAAAAQTAIFGKEVTVIFDTMSALPHIKSGRLRALAVSSPKRVSELPNVPTMQESGFPGFDMGFWVGIFVPKATPASVVSLLNREIAAATADPAVLEKLVTQGSVITQTPAEFAAKIAAETKQLEGVVLKANIKVD
jgi:tripartite-type tricarboxylate transporter receptor subunit TctC